jgi:spore maturation protein CgeB
VKIVVFGLTISSSWGNGHATLWRGLCRALERRRVQVVFYERDTHYYAQARDCHSVPGGALVLYDSWDAVRRRAAEDIADAEAAMITSFCPDGVAAGELVLSAGRALRVFYDLDTPVTLGRLQRGEPLPYIGPAGLSEFDLVLSYTGGQAPEELRRGLGARQVLPLYGHADPEVHRPAAPVERYRADLSYLGTFAADRQPALNALLVEPARRRAQQRFVIAGALYPQDFPWMHNIGFLQHLPPGDHPAFFSSSRLTLNVTRPDMIHMGWCPSGRLFEAAACGAAILSDAWEGLETFFSPGEEILLAHTSEEALAALDLADEDIRRLAKAGRERVLAQHTSERRAEELLGAFERAGPGSSRSCMMET